MTTDTEWTGEQILNLLVSEDCRPDIKTIREYLHAMLYALWSEGEGFSGKRPLGNSGWEWDLYKALAVGGAVTATFDEDGELDKFSDKSRKKADKLIFSAIAAAFAEPNAADATEVWPGESWYEEQW